ncbi:Metallophosphoesterase [Rhodovastum atsumiense]|uniref:Metallophosphoesterase n=1 Tax=Rhodovastum atsumiense TaxID=504468 RepID=A0A5M6IIS8_9PROT|nr:metallophosphoesterase [Rhodovastum atsumiense]KAA5608186.1 metallophosphoesterase [Rhodovastum atsumiense]CAH2602553.1 Metallophosphoesterase [Rhodovastum atsumiense]
MPSPTGTFDRRGLLRCMAWTGTAMLWTISGGVPRSRLLGLGTAAAAEGGLSFVQISDSHIGFAAAPNADTPGTLREAVAQVARQKGDAAFMLHTGDVSQLSRPAQFDTAAEIIRGAGLDVHYVPGEHDVLVDDGAPFFARFTPQAPRGWYSWDQQGVHFVALNNVQDLKAGGLGNLGAEQLDWLGRDLAGRPASQPVVVFAHVPLWLVSEAWGWGTDDGAQALALLRRFGSVTVLNGHIHQVMQKVEGTIAFHTACSTAFPQPAPGTAASPGPIRDLPAGRLRATLGVTRVARVAGQSGLAVIDTPLGA